MIFRTAVQPPLVLLHNSHDAYTTRNTLPASYLKLAVSTRCLTLMYVHMLSLDDLLLPLAFTGFNAEKTLDAVHSYAKLSLGKHIVQTLQFLSAPALFVIAIERIQAQ
jgi:hypothetical protein